MHSRQAQSGFSLVELSIVLVILGLLTGGILAGQSLIRAAELRSITSEFQRYSAAVYAFRDRYMALPGDMSNATRFWGLVDTANGCTSNHGLATASMSGTCDGNGNGVLQSAAGAGFHGEAFHTWRQMALAGLIEGTYNGMSGIAGGLTVDPGLNVPISRLNGASWLIVSRSGGDANFYALPTNNLMQFGAQQSSGSNYRAILKPEEAWNIDTKMDDGKPAQGTVWAIHWDNKCATAESGATTNTNYNARYRLEDSTVQCALLFFARF